MLPCALCERLLNFLHTGRKCSFPHFVLCDLIRVLIQNKTELETCTFTQYYHMYCLQKLWNFPVFSLCSSLVSHSGTLDEETFKMSSVEYHKDKFWLEFLGSVEDMSLLGFISSQRKEHSSVQLSSLRCDSDTSLSVCFPPVVDSLHRKSLFCV